MGPAGIVVFDDLTPAGAINGRWTAAQIATDPLRNFWLNDVRVNAIELVIRPEEAILIASRDNDTEIREK